MKRTIDIVEAKIPPEIEVLYPWWRYGGDEPGIYDRWKGCRKNDDHIWGWVPHPDLRRCSTSKACQRAVERFGVRLFRPPPSMDFHRDVAPVRMWTGRRYRWFWVKIPKQ